MMSYKAKQNMCVSDLPADSPFLRRPIQFLYCATQRFFLLGII